MLWAAHFNDGAKASVATRLSQRKQEESQRAAVATVAAAAAIAKASAVAVPTDTRMRYKALEWNVVGSALLPMGVTVDAYTAFLSLLAATKAYACKSIVTKGPTTAALGHACTSDCGFFRHGSHFFCKVSGVAHVCTVASCDTCSGDDGVCTLTGLQHRTKYYSADPRTDLPSAIIVHDGSDNSTRELVAEAIAVAAAAETIDGGTSFAATTATKAAGGHKRKRRQPMLAKSPTSSLAPSSTMATPRRGTNVEVGADAFFKWNSAALNYVMAQSCMAAESKSPVSSTAVVVGGLSVTAAAAEVAMICTKLWMTMSKCPEHSQRPEYFSSHHCATVIAMMQKGGMRRGDTICIPAHPFANGQMINHKRNPIDGKTFRDSIRILQDCLNHQSL